MPNVTARVVIKSEGRKKKFIGDNVCNDRGRGSQRERFEDAPLQALEVEEEP